MAARRGLLRRSEDEESRDLARPVTWAPPRRSRLRKRRKRRKPQSAEGMPSPGDVKAYFHCSLQAWTSVYMARKQF